MMFTNPKTKPRDEEDSITHNIKLAPKSFYCTSRGLFDHGHQAYGFTNNGLSTDAFLPTKSPNVRMFTPQVFWRRCHICMTVNIQASNLQGSINSHGPICVNLGILHILQGTHKELLQLRRGPPEAAFFLGPSKYCKAQWLQRLVPVFICPQSWELSAMTVERIETLTDLLERRIARPTIRRPLGLRLANIDKARFDELVLVLECRI